MYTSHGLQIPGTPVEAPRPTTVTPCGGLFKCFPCYGEARNATRVMISDDHMLLEVSFMDNLDPQTRAKLAVALYINNHGDD